MLYITAVRVTAPGTKAAHISRTMWLNSSDGKAGESTVKGIVEYIEKPPSGGVQVAGPAGPTDVKVVRPQNGDPYLRTNEDNTTKDNLLSLPRF